LVLSSPKPDPEAHEALAKCYLETFQLGQAEGVINKWISDTPGDLKPYFWKLELARKVNADAPSQIEILNQILQLDPRSEQAHLALAEIHLHYHRLDDAARQYAAVLELRPDSSAAYHGLAVVTMEHGDEDGTVRNFQHAMKLEPRNIRLLMDRAKFEVGRGRLESGLSFLDQAMSIDTDDPEIHYQRGLVLTRLGRAALARTEMETSTRLREERKHIKKLLDDMLAAPGDLDHQYDAAHWLFDHGHPEEGLRWAEKILRDQPRHPKTNRLLADYYEKQGSHGLANFYLLQAATE
jgi:tetratricopeptide (TPR) repeat protein